MWLMCQYIINVIFYLVLILLTTLYDMSNMGGNNDIITCIIYR